MNLIASAVEWLNQSRKTKTSVPLLKNATENVLDDMVLYLVYVYERDALSIRIKDSLRARGANAAGLRNTGTSDIFLYTGTLSVVAYHLKKIDTEFVKNPAAQNMYTTQFYIL
jgi:hypothetical protein